MASIVKQFLIINHRVLSASRAATFLVPRSLTLCQSLSTLLEKKLLVSSSRNLELYVHSYPRKVEQFATRVCDVT
jgi:hypothetical protein